jgi:hypothetical protein
LIPMNLTNTKIVDFFQKRITHVKGELAGNYVILEDW